MIEISGVTKIFNPGKAGEVTAIASADLTVAPGEFVSLIGPSGCGKSTLLRLIADLVPPTTGTVTVAGEPAAEARRDRAYGMVFQKPGLFDWRTVRKNVELPLELRGTGRAERRSRAAEMLDLVGLADFAEHYPSQLSGGMQQRVSIARALADAPPLLLMDEPFGALDEMTRERLQSELLRICSTTGTTVVFVTHSIDEAVYLSDRVAVMSARPGRITAILDIPLPARTEALRQTSEYFSHITSVRQALRAPAAVPAPSPSAVPAADDQRVDS
ncbi:ABC transporter ATP-binding protein [Actinocorallia lasiicapitis]